MTNRPRQTPARALRRLVSGVASVFAIWAAGVGCEGVDPTDTEPDTQTVSQLTIAVPERVSPAPARPTSLQPTDVSGRFPRSPTHLIVTSTPRPRIANTAAPLTRPTPKPSDIPSPAPPPEPVVVHISLEEAEREVLSWLDPTREPRIEWSRYVRRAELATAVRTTAWSILRDQWEGIFHDFPLECPEDQSPDACSDPIIVVIASSRSISLSDIDPESHSERGDLQRSSEERLTIVGGFDASTGARLVAMPTSGWPGAGPEYELSHALERMPSADVVLDLDGRSLAARHVEEERSTSSRAKTATARRVEATPTAEPTAVPRSAFLTQATLPDSLRSTFRAHPLAPGSSKTWRFTHVNGGVRWIHLIVTETVKSAWLEGDTAVVRSDVVVDSVTALKNLPSPGARLTPRSGPRLRFVSPRVILGVRKDFAHFASDHRLQPADRRAYPIEAIHPFALDISVALIGGADSDFGRTDVTDGPFPMTTGIGNFDDCWSTMTVGGSSWGSSRWICEGVGAVRYRFHDGAAYHGSDAVAELLRWTRTTLPER